MNRTRNRDKRQFERIPVSMDVCFFTEDSKHFGKVVDCSADGMYMETRIPASVSPEVYIILPHQKRLLKVPCSVVRIEKKDNMTNGVGLRIQSESEQYLAFALSRSLGLPD